MFRRLILVVFAVAVIGGIFITYGAQNEESESSSEISLKDVKFKEVRVIPTSESTFSMMSDADLAELNKMVISADENIVAYGFSDAEKTVHQKFFAIGNLYADLVSKLNGKYDREAVAEEIKALRDGLDNLDAPNSMYIYLFNLGNMVRREEYPKEVISKFLSMLYPFVEDFARSSSASGAMVSLQAGHWLVDFAIAAAGGQGAPVRQPEAAAYFATFYTGMGAPKGVIDGFKEIADITSKPEMGDEDFERLMSLSEDIRKFLK